MDSVKRQMNKNKKRIKARMVEVIGNWKSVAEYKRKWYAKRKLK